MLWLCILLSPHLNPNNIYFGDKRNESQIQKWSRKDCELAKMIQLLVTHFSICLSFIRWTNEISAFIYLYTLQMTTANAANNAIIKQKWKNWLYTHRHSHVLQRNKILSQTQMWEINLILFWRALKSGLPLFLEEKKWK